MREIKRYADVGLHRRMCEIIRRHSENKQDIRDIASQLIEWQNVKRILDLGCGYGWFEEAIDGSFDLIMGIDPFEENRNEFLKVCSRISKEVCFKKAILPTPIDMPEGHFDLILSIYSLYFFPDMITEAKRLLNKEGVFLTITHSESMLEEGERYFSFRNLKQIIRRFSAENGEETLKRVFSRVSYVDYPNNLLFFRKTERTYGHT
jgi:SAM-dependent methyltransferase